MREHIEWGWTLLMQSISQLNTMHLWSDTLMFIDSTLRTLNRRVITRSKVWPGLCVCSQTYCLRLKDVMMFRKSAALTFEELST